MVQALLEESPNGYQAWQTWKEEKKITKPKRLYSLVPQIDFNTYCVCKAKNTNTLDNNFPV